MTDSSTRYRHFRLNLDQQRKRAKELLAGARAGDGSALTRIRTPGNIGRGAQELKLADAQGAIARELRFANWAELKRHVNAMTSTRAAIEADATLPTHKCLDADQRTLHIRCGSDIRATLKRLF